MSKRNRVLILVAVTLLLLVGCEGPFFKALRLKSAEIRSLDRAATRLYKQGRYAEALPYVLEIVAVLEAEVEPEDLKLAQPLNNLAVIYEKLGKKDEAEKLYLRVLAIIEKKVGPDDRVLAVKLGDLAAIYSESGRWAEAEALYSRELSILEKDPDLGPDHPLLIQARLGLAEVYGRTDRPAGAEQQYQAALASAERSLGREHPLAAQALKGLAALKERLAEYKKAEQLYLTALGLTEGNLGAGTPPLAAAFEKLARFYADHGEYEKAYDFLLRAEETNGNLLRLLLGMTSEVEKQRFLAARKAALDLRLLLISQGYVHRGDAAGQALAAGLAQKGLALESSRKLLAAKVLGHGREAVEAFKELVLTQTDLTRLSLAGPGSGPAEKYRKNLAVLTSRR
ncbi:MAG: tetratricopeptide repeat protein, partial [Thermodesulfobacteriota bacterium]